jgi:hypothetical protein
MHNADLLDENNGQRSFSLIRERLKEKDWEEELLAVQLIEVLNNTILIKIEKKESRSVIIRYIKDNYTKRHIHNQYFSMHPLYRRIISYCAYYRLMFLLRLIVGYKNFLRKKRG